MKSYITTGILSFTFFISLMAGNSTGQNEVEGYVNDIPFNTELIAGTTDNHDMFIKLWPLEEEATADDIPFNTATIAQMHEIFTPEFLFEEEAYVDDIPFNTELIASHILANQLQSEEEPVQDIPFATDAIYNDVMATQMAEQYEVEEEVSDIPFNTELIASNAVVDREVMCGYTDEASVNDVPFECIDDFLQVAFCDYYNEEPVSDIPFDTEEIFCANVCCEKNKNKIRFTRSISTAQHSFTGTALIQTQGKIEFENLGVLLESLEKIWMDELSSRK